MKIKFRGITEDGKYIFSDSIQFNVDGKGREFCRLKDEFGNWLFVDPESVVQFIGYDADGNEIYEGDSLIDSDGFEHFAPLGTMFEGNFYWVGEKILNYKLKGRGKNENLL